MEASADSGFAQDRRQPSDVLLVLALHHDGGSLLALPRLFMSGHCVFVDLLQIASDCYGI